MLNPPTGIEPLITQEEAKRLLTLETEEALIALAGSLAKQSGPPAPVLQRKPTPPLALDPERLLGKFLHSSCADEFYGPVTRVARDDNGLVVVDFKLKLEQVNEFLDVDNLCYLRGSDNTDDTDEVTFADVPVEKFEVNPYDPKYTSVVLSTPGNGCYRCTKLFTVYDKPEQS